MIKLCVWLQRIRKNRKRYNLNLKSFWVFTLFFHFIASHLRSRSSEAVSMTEAFWLTAAISLTTVYVPHCRPNEGLKRQFLQHQTGESFNARSPKSLKSKTLKRLSETQWVSPAKRRWIGPRLVSNYWDESFANHPGPLFLPKNAWKRATHARRWNYEQHFDRHRSIDWL